MGSLSTSTFSVAVPAKAGDRVIPFVVGLTAAVLVALGGAAADVPRFGLRPYVDVVTPGAVGAFASSWLASGPIVALVAGLSAGLLAAAATALPRRLLGRSVPWVAGLFAVLPLVAPAWLVQQRHEGGAAIAFGGLFVSVALAASCGVFGRPGGIARAVACVGAAVACAAHPVWFGASLLAGWAGVATSDRKASPTSGLLVVLCGAVGVGVGAGFGVTPETLGAALTDLLCAPIEVFNPNVRFDFPTGFESMARGTTAVLGGAVWTMVIAWICMVAGVDRGMLLAVALLLSALGLATHPETVPGSPWTSLAFVVLAMPLLTVAFAPISGGVLDGIVGGLMLALIVVAGVGAAQRRPWLESRSVAFRFPRDASGNVVEWEREPDPARLVLFLETLAEKDAYAPAVADTARKRIDEEAPAWRAERLRTIFSKREKKVPSVTGTPEVVAALDRIVLELNLVEGLEKEGIERAPEALEALGRAVPDALEVFHNGGRTIRGLQELPRYEARARHWAELGSRLGLISESIALREAICVFHPDDRDDRARLGMHRVMAGQWKEGIADLENALKSMDGKGRYAGLVRGYLGVARWRSGDATGAATDLDRGWSQVAPGGSGLVTQSVLPDTVDYYIVAEIALARLELAKAGTSDAAATQAAKDLEGLLKGPLDFGLRRLPALVLAGRLAALKGENERALVFLREARGLTARSAKETADGPDGRILHPRWRKMGLLWLADVLKNTPGTDAERAEVEREIGAG